MISPETVQLLITTLSRSSFVTFLDFSLPVQQPLLPVNLQNYNTMVGNQRICINMSVHNIVHKGKHPLDNPFLYFPDGKNTGQICDIKSYLGVHYP